MALGTETDESSRVLEKFGSGSGVPPWSGIGHLGSVVRKFKTNAVEVGEVKNSNIFSRDMGDKDEVPRSVNW